MLSCDFLKMMLILQSPVLLQLNATNFHTAK